MRRAGEQESLLGRVTPKKRPQERCTDPICLLIFLLALAAVIYISVYAYRTGEPEKILSGVDYNGNICGKDDAVRDQKYLYYCFGNLNPGELDFDHPICVSSCPSQADVDAGSSHTCYASGASVLDPATTSTPDYATRAFLGRICLPTSDAIQDAFWSGVSDSDFESFSLHVTQYTNSWQVLLLVAGIGLLISFLYLLLLWKCGYCLVCVAVSILIIVPLTAGTLLICYSQDWLPDEVTDFLKLDEWESERDKEYELIVGIILAAIGLIFAVMACCSMQDVKKAMGAISVACECIFHEPLLLLQPIFAMLLQLAVLIWALITGLYLLSCADITRDPQTSTRKIHLDTVDIIYLVAFIFLALWVFEFVRGWCDFSVADAVEEWCKAHYDNRMSNPFGWIVGFFKGIMHLGSFAFGASIMFIMDILRGILNILTCGPCGKSINKCCTRTCCCCANWSRLVYVEIAIKGNENFITAMKWVGKTMMQTGSSFIDLLALLPFFQVVGVMLVAVLGGVSAFWAVTLIPPWNDKDSEHYISDPGSLAIFAGFLSLLIAIPVVTLMGTAAEVILYFAARYELGIEEDRDDPDPTCGCISFQAKRPKDVQYSRKAHDRLKKDMGL